MNKNEDERRELPDMPEGFTRSGDDIGVSCDDIPCGLCERIIHLPSDDWIRNDRTCVYYCRYNECAETALLREGRSDSLEVVDGVECGLGSLTTCAHCQKVIHIDECKWTQDMENTGLLFCDECGPVTMPYHKEQKIVVPKACVLVFDLDEPCHHAEHENYLAFWGQYDTKEEAEASIAAAAQSGKGSALFTIDATCYPRA